MPTAHNFYFPRIGPNRELKKLVEGYWNGKNSKEKLVTDGELLVQDIWNNQTNQGMDAIPVGDFHWYDHMLQTSLMLGAIPERFIKDKECQDADAIDLAFAMGRGTKASRACAMRKWFNTNYHYIVPEITQDMTFNLWDNTLAASVEAAQKQGHKVKPVLIGPVTWLYMAQIEQEQEFDKLQLLDRMLPVYRQVIDSLIALGVEWVQIDEPILSCDLDDQWLNALERSMHDLTALGCKVMLATYYASTADNLDAALQLPGDGLHLDLVSGPEQLAPAVSVLSDSHKVLSAGIVPGRTIWKTDLRQVSETLATAHEKLGDRLWIAPACPLIHCPVDLTTETRLDDELRSWISFSIQKLGEVRTLCDILADPDSPASQQALASSDAVVASRKSSTRIHNQQVKDRVSALKSEDYDRADPYSIRRDLQQEQLNLPLLPTTTIGSFPQTREVRQLRAKWRRGDVDNATYIEGMRAEIQACVKHQDDIGLDVYVHGEPERNDMVEYFGELLDGFAFTSNAWIQSYGTRCTKPPIIFGDVSRRKPMTVERMDAQIAIEVERRGSFRYKYFRFV